MPRPKGSTSSTDSLNHNLSTASAKHPMEELLSQAKGWSLGLRRGQIVDGTVVAISAKEILVDVGAKSEGLVSGRELTTISHLIGNLKVGDVIKAQIVTPEDDAGQIVLSLRPFLETKYWEALEHKRQNQETLMVKGLESVRGGLLVEINLEGLIIRGFLPTSQMTASRVADSKPSAGAEIAVKVVEVNQVANRLVVSEKAAISSSDRSQLAKELTRYKVGQLIEGVITAVVPFGLFVTVTADDKEETVEGLVHISEVAWEKIDDLSKRFSMGDKLEARVLSIDETQGRLNLSIKSLQENPWEEIAQQYPAGSKVKGTVARLTPFGSFVTISEGIEGLLHASKIPIGEMLKVGQQVDCEVEAVDVSKRRISLALVLKEKPVTYR